jgi:hypothetical protein
VSAGPGVGGEFCSVLRERSVKPRAGYVMTSLERSSSSPHYGLTMKMRLARVGWVVWICKLG